MASKARVRRARGYEMRQRELNRVSLLLPSATRCIVMMICYRYCYAGTVSLSFPFFFYKKKERE